VPLTGRAGSNPASDTQLPAETTRGPSGSIRPRPVHSPDIPPRHPPKSFTCSLFNSLVILTLFLKSLLP
jgi:hypothetical protein